MAAPGNIPSVCYSDEIIVPDNRLLKVLYVGSHGFEDSNIYCHTYKVQSTMKYLHECCLEN